MEYGTLAGLSVNLGFDKKIDDLKYLQQAQKQKEAMDMAKAKMFMEDIEFQNASNPYDATIIKNEALQTIQKIGELKRNNVNFYSDVNAQTQKKLLLHEMKSTPAIYRSIAYKDFVNQHSKTLEDAAKNPDKYNFDDIERINQEIKNYRDYGHPEGEVGFKRDGGPKPLVYTPPGEIPDFTEIHRKVGTALEPDTFKKVYNGRDGAGKIFLSEDALTKKAVELYSKEKKSYDYAYKGQSPQQVVETIKNSLRPFIPVKEQIGERNPVSDAIAIESYKSRLKAAEKAMDEGKLVDPYKHVILDSHQAITDGKELARTFGSSIPYFYKLPDGSITKSQGDEFHYTGEFYDKNIRRDGNGNILPYDKDGVKRVTGHVYKSLDWGDKQGIISQSWGTDPEDYKIKPELDGDYELYDTPPDKNGKSHRVLKVKVFSDVNANSPQYALKYNKDFTTSKQRNQIGINDNLLNVKRQVFQDEAGNKFVKGPNGYEPYKD